MITPNIRPEKAWQMVLDQLRREMSRASFDTWVRDAKFYSFENGVLTIGTANSYASEWLASRLTSTVTHIFSGLLGQSISVQFIVHEEPFSIEDAQIASRFQRIEA
jgi:chromosomal replication initiator protein